MEPLRHIGNKGFGGVIFRRTSPMIRNEGGLWDESMSLYPLIGAKPKETVLQWVFPSGAKLKFAHMQYESDRLDWQGTSIAFIGFDELTHFTKLQFFYMLSRSRSGCGVRPYIRATCNPDADSWVAEFISWWIDQETGFPIPERAGVLRYFVRVDDAIMWADTPEELMRHATADPDLPKGAPPPLPKSVTFIPARLQDNQILMSKDPGYLSNLMAQNAVDRARLLGGNWKIRPAAGLYFRREWCQAVEAIPHGTVFARGWDLAGTPKTSDNDPDWTVGTKIGRMSDGRFLVVDNRRMRVGPIDVERALLNTAMNDGTDVRIGLPQDPGQAGKAQVQNLVRLLAGFDARSKPVTGDKLTRFKPFSAQAEAGNVLYLRGDWNDAWFTALEGFPDALHDDDVDATSEAFDLLQQSQRKVFF